MGEGNDSRKQDNQTSRRLGANEAGVLVALESRVESSNGECTRRTRGKGGIPSPVVRSLSGFRFDSN
jgi:hypothetical protein